MKYGKWTAEIEMNSDTNADTIKSHDVRAGTENQTPQHTARLLRVDTQRQPPSFIRLRASHPKMSESTYVNITADRTWDMGRCTKRKQTPQHTGSDSVKIRRSRAAVVCLVLLCVLLLTAVIVLCVHIHTKNTNYTEETPQLLTRNNSLTEETQQLLTKITNLTEERGQLLTKYINMTNERNGLLIKNDNLTKQREQFNQKRKQLQKILSETDGWLYSNFSFYFISSLKKSLNESRRYCIERGADLIIINNRGEQDFAKKVSRGYEFWIGLTDSYKEGRWKWVDGSTLTSGFWGSGEPNGQRRENCVVSYPSGWCDYPCNDAFRWICEKQIFKKKKLITYSFNNQYIK
uniref:C-type lectin domain-containing protein n=1 Tax=Cyprinus carpio carpio TaxID=630221 RepID=A0A9J7X156_CYPCA